MVKVEKGLRSAGGGSEQGWGWGNGQKGLNEEADEEEQHTGGRQKLNRQENSDSISRRGSGRRLEMARGWAKGEVLG